MPFKFGVTSVTGVTQQLKWLFIKDKSDVTPAGG